MFTGIIEELGRVAAVRNGSAAVRLDISAVAVVADARVGDSIAVNGVCLTAITIDESGFGVDVIPETASRTSLGGLGAGDRVNLERPTRVGGRLDGHIVQGHVDGVGVIGRMETADDGGVVMSVSIPDGLGGYVVEKGSITVDGVSLTVAGRSDDELTVALIPHTLAQTTLGERVVGDRVNLEVDIIAKYVAQSMSAYVNDAMEGRP